MTVQQSSFQPFVHVLFAHV
jgi:hypothetical protein